MAESITVNGVDLATYATSVEDISALWRTGGLRGEDYEIPGRHGLLTLPRRLHGAPVLPLPLWLLGVDPNTGEFTPGTTVDLLRERARELVALFYQDPLTIVHTYPDGTQVQAQARLAVEPMDFTRQPGTMEYGKVAVALTVPSGFWTETRTTTQTLSGVDGATLSFTAFVGATAPMDELTVTFGPANNPKIQNGSIWLQYKGIVGPGQSAVFPCADWDYFGTGGLTVDFEDIAHLGSARWFELLPGAGLQRFPQVGLTHTGGGTASVTLSGHKKQLIG